MKNMKNKGITLIALIITVIVLLILAGVTIAAISGNESVPEKAIQARRENDIGATKDTVALLVAEKIQDYYGNKYITQTLNSGTLIDFLEEELGTNDVIVDKYAIKFEFNNSDKTKAKIIVKKETEEIAKGIINDSGIITWEQNTSDPRKIADLIPETGEEVIVLSTTENTKVLDDLDNEVVIPAGFGIASCSGRKVEDGVVIEDATNTNTLESQFVWIPVGKFYKGTPENKIEDTLTLGRYTFENNTGYVSGPFDGSQVISSSFYEEATGEKATVARTIEVEENGISEKKIEFVEKAKQYGGYYIGRFEAGVENGQYNSTKDLWKPIDLTQPIKTVCKKGAKVYNYVYRGGVQNYSGALELAEGMYNNTKFKSELMTSFAWDTALVFIQRFGTDSENYANLNSLNTRLSSTGNAQKNGKNDVQCNIYDMASNAAEFTTEYNIVSNKPCVKRGGSAVGAGGGCAKTRLNASANGYDGAAYVTGFRPILYLI